MEGTADAGCGDWNIRVNSPPLGLVDPACGSGIGPGGGMGGIDDESGIDAVWNIRVNSPGPDSAWGGGSGGAAAGRGGGG